jgi:hypothetical protein
MRRLFYLTTLLGCIALFAACEKEDNDSSVPKTLDGTRWVTTKKVGEKETLLKLEFFEGGIAQYTIRARANSGSLTPRSEIASGDNVGYNYKYSYSQPNVNLYPVSQDAPALTGKVLGGRGTVNQYITLYTTDGAEFFSAFQDDGSYIWQ